jgi:hypothetical protein
MKLIGDCNRRGTTNSKPPGRIIKIGQSETGRSSQIIFITFSSRLTAVMHILPGLAFCATMLGQNHFLEPYSHVLTFLHPILMCRSHTGHTAGMHLVHLHQRSVCDPAKLFLTFFITNFFPTPPIKLKLGLQVGSRLLRATHLDQSNYLANQKQGSVNKYDWTVSAVFQAPSSLPGNSLHWTNEPHPRFPVQGPIVSVSGDALRSYVLSSLFI